MEDIADKTHLNFRKEIRNVTYDNDKASLDKAISIYSYIDENFVKSENDTPEPHFEVYVHLIRSITKPRLSADNIPFLLNALATVESTRKAALEKGKTALVYDAYFKSLNNEKPIFSLSHGQRATIQADIDAAGPMREIFLELIINWCKIDIHSLWMSSIRSPVRAAELLIRFNQHFPLVNPAFAEDTCSPFYHILSDEERDELNVEGHDIAREIADSYAWAQENRGSQSLHDFMLSERHLTQWKGPDRSNPDLMLTEYLTAVTKLVYDLESIFQ